MATFPYFPRPPPPPVHPISPPPPPPHVFPPPPPPPHVVPRPPPPHVVPRPPPPPFHPITPPPHVLPPPPPSPDNGPTVIIVVFISFGCLFFVAFCFFALWCLVKRRKKMVQETDIIRTHEHLRVKEAIVQGPHGPEPVVLSIEDDKCTEEEIIKNEKLEGKHMHAKSGEVSATEHLEATKSSSNPSIHQVHHRLEHKH